ncbi:MAG: hypothetical protein ACRDNZ_23415 [Streptosporangiaceae bacterium]
MPVRPWPPASRAACCVVARAVPGTLTRFVPVDMEAALAARRHRASLLRQARASLASSRMTDSQQSALQD